MKSGKILKILAIFGSAMLVGITLFFNFSLLDEVQTTMIAKSAFISLAKHEMLSVEDFDLLPVKPPMQDERMVVLTWKSKTKPNCRVEVDIDRRYSNARPTWNCQ